MFSRIQLAMVLFPVGAEVGVGVGVEATQTKLRHVPVEQGFKKGMQDCCAAGEGEGPMAGCDGLGVVEVVALALHLPVFVLHPANPHG